MFWTNDAMKKRLLMRVIRCKEGFIKILLTWLYYFAVLLWVVVEEVALYLVAISSVHCTESSYNLVVKSANIHVSILIECWIQLIGQRLKKYSLVLLKLIFCNKYNATRTLLLLLLISFFTEIKC